MSDAVVGVVSQIGDVENVTIFDAHTIKTMKEMIAVFEGMPHGSGRLWASTLRCAMERGHFAVETREALVLLASEQCATCGRQVFREHPEDFRLMGFGWIARCGRRLSAFPTDAPACEYAEDEDDADTSQGEQRP